MNLEDLLGYFCPKFNLNKKIKEMEGVKWQFLPKELVSIVFSFLEDISLLYARVGSMISLFS
jgi:hypothetical protein